jgi:hypothetical protein
MINNEQKEALQQFKSKHGRNWKLELRLRWMRGTDVNEANGHLLRQVRNNVGPSGLDKIRI